MTSGWKERKNGIGLMSLVPNVVDLRPALPHQGRYKGTSSNPF